MEKYLTKIKSKYYWLVAFVLTAITYAITFSYMGLLGNGKYIIARSDLKQQYIPFIEYFCSVLRGEHGYNFSWTLNLGTGTSLLFAYYTLSPFNIIYLILGEKLALTATAIVIILKASTAAATFQIFITKYLRKSYYETVLFSMMYALCGFQVCYYFDLMWMDAFYMLPVITLGIYKLIREKKILCLLFSYAYVFAVNFYMGYIVGIGSFFLYLLYYLYIYKRIKFKEKIIALGRYFICVVVAMLVPAAIWLPAVIQLFSNIEKNYPAFSLQKCNLLFIINNLFMGEMQTLYGITPFIYCGLLSFIMLPFYFVNKRKNMRKRIYYAICLGFFCCLFLIKPLNMIMHAFDQPEMFAHRFSYFFSFIITIIACEQFVSVRNIRMQWLSLFSVFVLCVFLLCHFMYNRIWDEKFNANTGVTFAVNIVFWVGYIFIIKKIQEKKWNMITYRVVVTFFLMVELGSNAAMCMHRMEHTVMRQDTYSIISTIQKNTFEKIKKEDDSSFYRIAYISPYGTNQGFIFDYNAFDNFCTSEHTKTWKALEKLGIYRGIHTLKGLGTTPITTALFGIKYMIGGNSLECELNDASTYFTYQKNEYSLPLGFMVEEDVINYQFSDSPFENQDLLLSLMTGMKIQCFERIGMEMNIKDGEYIRTDDATYLQHQSGIEKNAEFQFRAPNTGYPLYIYFSQDRYAVSNSGNEIPKIKTNDITKNCENTVVEPELCPSRIIRIGLNEAGEYEFSIILPQNVEQEYYRKAYFCYYYEKDFLRAYRKLKSQPLEIEDYGDGWLKGYVQVNKNGILFTSIPYDKGWKVKVDGKNVDATPLLDGAFLGIEMEKGYHEIEMEYNPVGLKEGIAISLSVMGMVILYLSVKVVRRIHLYRKGINRENNKML